MELKKGFGKLLSLPALRGGFWCLLMGLVLGTRLWFFLDPDFGWHYQTGKLIASSGIPKTDPFSYTMPGFPYVDHAWLTDLLIYKIFSSTGNIGLVLLFLSVVFFLVFISLKTTKTFYPALFLPYMVVLLSDLSVRPLVFTWLFFAIIIYLIFDETRWQKWRLLLPVIFLAWANVHGGFIVGLTAIATILVADLIYRREELLKDTSVFVVSTLITLANPYGIGLWREVYMTVISSNLHFSIAEWFPAFLLFNPLTVLMATLAIISLFLYKRAFHYRLFIFAIIFIPYSFTAVRNMPLLVILCLPIITQGLENLRSVVSEKNALPRFNQSMRIFLVIVLAVLPFNLVIISSLTKDFTESNFYPQKAVQVLQEKLPTGEILSSYNWGGYLIWKLPEKKVYMDGRMAIWPGAMDNYNKITSDETFFQNQVKKYNIKTILWSTPKHNSVKLPDIVNKFILKPNAKEKKPDFTEILQKNGWIITYEDEISTIYTNNK